MSSGYRKLKSNLNPRLDKCLNGDFLFAMVKAGLQSLSAFCIVTA